MKLKIDSQAVNRLAQVTDFPYPDGRRRYYVTQSNDDHLAIIVCRGGLDLHDLIGKVVDAQIGWDGGTTGFVLDDHVGRRHTKVTIFRVLRFRGGDSDLSAILRNAPEK